MSTILVVDDMPVFREPIAACLEAHGYTVHCAANGQEALALVKAGRPDLVLLDLGMPVMDGLAFLEVIGADPSTRDLPVILLTAIAEKDSVLRAAKLGVRDYLLKSRFSLKELLSRIAARLQAGPGSSAAAAQKASPGEAGAARLATPKPSQPPEPSPASSATTLAGLQRVLTQAQLDEKMRACEEIGVLSPAVDNVVRLTSHASCSVHDLASAIKQDQGLALKVLKLANSVAYARGIPVSSVDVAVQRVGMAQIRQMVLNLGVMDRFGAGMKGERLNALKFWEHSIACGLIAAELMRSRGGNADDVDAAFTMSLLHDTGRAVLAEQLGEVYENVMTTADKLQVPLEQVESRMLGSNHAELIRDLLRRWQFAQHLAEPIAKHHLPINRMREAGEKIASVIGVLALADRLAHALLIGSSGNDAVYPVDELMEWLKIDADSIARISATIATQTTDLKYVLLSRAPNTEWPDARRQFASRLLTPTRPLFVGENAGADPYGIFYSVLTTEVPDGPPNLLVVHLRQPAKRAKLAELVAAAEEKSRLARLPMVIISPDGSGQLDERTMAGRVFELVRSPASVSRLIEAANRLLTPTQATTGAPAAARRSDARAA